MAPESLDAVDLELRTQLEEGIEIPRPLRIIKQSGTYTTADGSISLRPGALVIPRRVSSRSVSTNTASTQQEGPFGCLTIHKKRGRGFSTVLPEANERSSRKAQSIESTLSQRHESDQLLEELLARVGSSSDWVEERQGLEFDARNEASSVAFLPPHQFAKLPTTLGPQILSYLRIGDPPDSSSSFPLSPDVIRPLKSNSFLKRSLLRFPKSKKTSLKVQPTTINSAPRDLSVTPPPDLSAQALFQGQPKTIDTALQDISSNPQHDHSSQGQLQEQPKTINSALQDPSSNPRQDLSSQARFLVQAKRNNTALRDLVNIPRSKTSSVRINSQPSYSTQAHQAIQQDKSKTQHRLPLKENFRRSSTVASLTDIFRKLSTTVSRSASSSHLRRSAIDLDVNSAATSQHSYKQDIHLPTIDLFDKGVTTTTSTSTRLEQFHVVNMQVHSREASEGSKSPQSVEAQQSAETVNALKRRIKELETELANSQPLHPQRPLAISVSCKKEYDTVVNNVFSSQVVKFFLTPTFRINGQPCHNGPARHCQYPGLRLPKVTLAFNFNPAVCHAHTGKMRSEESPNIRVPRAAATSSRWVLQVENLSHGEVFCVEGRVTFYPERMEVGHVRWLDLTSSWENGGFGDGGNFFVSRKGDTIEYVRPFSLPSPPPFPRRVVWETESNGEEEGGESEEESEEEGEEGEENGEEEEEGCIVGEGLRGDDVFGL